jgi:hypothetical protein
MTPDLGMKPVGELVYLYVSTRATTMSGTHLAFADPTGNYYGYKLNREPYPPGINLPFDHLKFHLQNYLAGQGIAFA